MRRTVARLAMLLLFLCFGCGGPVRESVTPVKGSGLKDVLLKLADSSDPDALPEFKDSISTGIEDLEATDAAKSKELAADYEALLKAGNPAAIKAQAKKMADKL